MTLYAQWKVSDCVVKFDVNGGNGQEYFGNKTLKSGTTFGDNLKEPGAPQYKHFAGWYTDKVGGIRYTAASTVPAISSLTLYARWEYNTYTIVFVGNKNTSGTMRGMTCSMESSYHLENNCFVRLGYKFIGWNTKEDGSGTSYENGALVSNLVYKNNGTITLYAQWDPLYCKITFDVNGGNGQQFMTARTIQQGYAIGKLPSSPGAPMYQHFAGWYDKKTGGNSYSDVSKAPYKSEVTLYARWEYDRYTIIFVGNKETGGSMTPMTCNRGSSYRLTGNGFRKDGYKFTGWNTKADGSGTSYANGAYVSNLVAKNNGTITLYAQWERAYCTISFDVNGGQGQSALGSKTVYQGESLKDVLPKSAPGAPIYKHFDGWYSGKTDGIKYTEDSKAPRQERFTLYARWADNKYTIVYEGNGCDNGMMKNTDAVCNKNIDLTPNGYVKTAYEFTGWNTQADGKGIRYDDKATVLNIGGSYKNNEIVHLYAQWKLKEYKITFDANGGYGQDQLGNVKIYLRRGDTYPKLPSGTTNGAGYEFTGWYTEKVGGKKIMQGLTFDGTSDQVLYAHYEKLEYTVSFDFRGAVEEQFLRGKTIKVKYGEVYGELPQLQDRSDGMRFGGWETDRGEKVVSSTAVFIAADHTLHVRWLEPTYVIHFDGNGAVNGSTADMEVSFTETVEIPECGYDDGTFFDAWTTNPDGTGEVYHPGDKVPPLLDNNHIRSITLYAAWKECMYTVTFYDGFTMDVLYRASANEVIHAYKAPIEAREIEGLTFIGWSDECGTPPVQGGYGDPMAPKGDFNLVLKKGEAGVIKKNINLYSVYEPKLDPPRVEVVYALMGGETEGRTVEYQNAGSSAPYEITITKIPPTRGRYKFKGWSWNYYSLDTYDPETTLSVKESGSCVVLYARWDPLYATLVIDENYAGGSVDSYPMAENEAFQLKAPSDRPFYTFDGWEDENGIVYPTGYIYFTPEEGMTLKAKWKPKTYEVQYYDQFTNRLLKTETLDVTKKLSEDAFPITGMVLSGYILKNDPQYRLFLHGTGFYDVLKYIEQDKYEFKAYYVEKQDLHRDGKFPVYYDLNGGTGGPSDVSYGDWGTHKVVTSTEEPTRDGCRFLGWSRFPDNKNYVKKGTEIECQDMTPELNGVILYAAWESKVTLTLRINDGKNETMEMRYIYSDFYPNDTVKLKKLHLYERKGYVFKGWGINRSQVRYDKKDEFIMPSESLTLYAIWSPDTVTFTFYGFSDEAIEKSTLRDYEFVMPDDLFSATGFKLRGWSTSPADNSVDYEIGRKITATKDRVFFAVYDVDVDSSKFSVVYIDNGGEGGPGVLEYEPGTTAWVSLKEPTRDGHKFLGWSYNNQYDAGSFELHYKKGKTEKLPVTSGLVTLFAVWEDTSANELIAALHRQFPSADIKKEMFETEYLSEVWERLSDRAYMVVRTEDKSHSKIYKDFKSTVLAMEYRGGKWEFFAYGTKETPWEQFRYTNIVCHTNSVSAFLDTFATVVNANVELAVDVLSIYFPAGKVAGWTIKGAHLIAALYQAWRDTQRDYPEMVDLMKACLDKDDFYECQLINELSSTADGIIIGKVMAVLSTKTNIPKNTLEILMSLFQTTESIIKDTYADFESALKRLDPYGHYDIALSEFQQRVYDQGFSLVLVGQIPDVVRKIYGY